MSLFTLEAGFLLDFLIDVDAASAVAPYSLFNISSIIISCLSFSRSRY